MRTTWTIAAVCLVSMGVLLAGGCGAICSKAPGLRGDWAFDEGSGDVAKNAVGPNNGRIHGSLKWTDGKIGKAIGFDGKGYVLIDSASYLNSAQYTFAAWVKLKATGDYQYIVWRAVPRSRRTRNAGAWTSG